MKNTLIAVGMAAALAVGSIGVAHADPINLLTNGDFSQTQSPNANPGEPTQFGGNVRTGFDGSGYGCSYGGDFITGWSGNGGYEFWYPSASAATGTTSCNQYNGDATQRLAGVTTAPGPNGTFVGLDGQSGIAASISQSVNLTGGTSYTLSFYWGATEEMSRNCTDYNYPADCLSETLGVSIGGASQAFTISNYTEQTFTGWQQESFTFTALSTGSSALTFASTGSPSLPPFAVLANVSLIEHVPEPSVLASFGGGLLGLGLLVIFGHRYEKRRRLAEDSAIA